MKTAKANVNAGIKPADIPANIADHITWATFCAIKRYYDDPAAVARYKKWLEDRQRNGVKANNYMSQ